MSFLRETPLYFLDPVWFYHRATVDLPRNPDLDVRRDLTELLVAVLGWALLHFVYSAIIRSIAPYWVEAKPVKDGPPKRKMGDVKKFETSAWKFFVYAGMFCYGYYAIKDEEWFLTPDNFTKNWPDAPPKLVHIYYVVTLAQYIHASVIIFWQPKQSDFIEMLIHHFVTIVLIVFSYVGSYWQIGATLIIFTDISDPVMELAKIFLYGGYLRIADVCFAAFSALFIFTRVIMFPKHCILVAIYKYDTINDGQVIPFYGLLSAFILILYAIFLYWTFLILKIAGGIIFKGGDDSRKDVRDLDEEEEPMPTNGKPKKH